MTGIKSTSKRLASRRSATMRVGVEAGWSPANTLSRTAPRDPAGGEGPMVRTASIRAARPGAIVSMARYASNTGNMASRGQEPMIFWMAGEYGSRASCVRARTCAHSSSDEMLDSSVDGGFSSRSLARTLSETRGLLNSVYPLIGRRPEDTIDDPVNGSTFVGGATWALLCQPAPPVPEPGIYAPPPVSGSTYAPLVSRLMFTAPLVFVIRNCVICSR
mmetsp:Transcript_13411/g.38903  ORF Transcript_13411/g.38903 Transcript_13411/m.38903 type:complete len:218 (-) Transcript_13411:980-1633(-)